MEKRLPNHDGSLSRDELLIWLMDEYGKRLVRLAFMYVKNEQLAEDIVQDVFEKCYKNLDRFQKKSSYKTWLYQITVNSCKDKLKSWSYRNMIFMDFFSFQAESKERSLEEKVKTLLMRYQFYILIRKSRTLWYLTKKIKRISLRSKGIQTIYCVY
ncbi:sigma-70 family RNA polymerase sigma factor [Fictibacillus sp. 18YEL24]|uniref:sigma-70 family RNA polymerase sigma factor n=1 Tax=Fictibacillus sp. 18YEL24 TaxID=2745875 RepID=UPI0018CE8561|nr:sigma-70 family RNA polymerase sigma factor [Fictibacillus sp. 18YEL24]MBH0171537.1 sigma-70 family RNA polymerase sigma factor [Fictibacillus sp. 18YEL24]